jgi:hypothetical protein
MLVKIFLRFTDFTHHLEKCIFTQGRNLQVEGARLKELGRLKLTELHLLPAVPKAGWPDQIGGLALG